MKVDNIPSISTDLEGYMLQPHVWTPEVAASLAVQQGLEKLSDDHWKVLDCMRDHYLEFGVPPPVHMLCKKTGFSLRTMYNLFPAGLARGAVKIAGLPKPSGHYP